MSRSSEPITITLPDDWTPEQAWAVHEILDDLLERIEARYGTAVQDWLAARTPTTTRSPTPSSICSRTTSTIRCPSERPSPGGSPPAGRVRTGARPGRVDHRRDALHRPPSRSSRSALLHLPTLHHRGDQCGKTASIPREIIRESAGEIKRATTPVQCRRGGCRGGLPAQPEGCEGGSRSGVPEANPVACEDARSRRRSTRSAVGGWVRNSEGSGRRRPGSNSCSQEARPVCSSFTKAEAKARGSPDSSTAPRSASYSRLCATARAAQRAESRRGQQDQDGKPRQLVHAENERRQHQKEQELAGEAQRGGDAADQIGEGHHPNVLVGDMGDLVRQHRRQLAPVEPPQQAVGDEDHGIVATSGREGVDGRRRQIIELRDARQAGTLRQRVQQTIESRSRARPHRTDAIQRHQQTRRNRGIGHGQDQHTEQCAPQQRLAPDHPGRQTEQEGEQGQQPQALKIVAQLVPNELSVIHAESLRSSGSNLNRTAQVWPRRSPAFPAGVAARSDVLAATTDRELAMSQDPKPHGRDTEVDSIADYQDHAETVDVDIDPAVRPVPRPCSAVRSDPRCRLWVGARCAGVSAAGLYRDRVRGVADADAIGLRASRLAGRGRALPEDRPGGFIRRYFGLREFAACADGRAARGVGASRVRAETRRGAVCLGQVWGRGAGAGRAAVYRPGRGGSRGAGRDGAGAWGARDLGHRGSAGGGALGECDYCERIAVTRGSPDVWSTS